MGVLWCYYAIVIVRSESLLTLIAYVQNFIYINNTKKRINLFAIVYMVNPILHVNKVLREQVDTCLRENFHRSTMTGMKLFKNKYVCYCISNVL